MKTIKDAKEFIQFVTTQCGGFAFDVERCLYLDETSHEASFDEYKYPILVDCIKFKKTRSLYYLKIYTAEDLAEIKKFNNMIQEIISDKMYKNDLKKMGCVFDEIRS